MLWSSGILPSLPSLMPQIARVQWAGGNWFSPFVEVLASSMIIISSYWAAMSFVWFCGFIALREDIRSDFLGACLGWGLLMSLVGLFILYIGGWRAAGVAATIWLLPIINSALPVVTSRRTGPVYSKAMAKMKVGKFEDAEWEVLHELEKCEDDFEGWLMLAELYATRFDDLAGAQRTIRDICAQPNTNPPQISIALHRLADWQLKIAEDPVAARQALEEICARLPGTHLAIMARHRMKQLPVNREALREQRKGRIIRLPALNEQLHDPGESQTVQGSQKDAAARANKCVEALKEDPDNVSVREELARLFAEALGRADLAIEQGELLLLIPGQPEQKMAEWLSLIAAWQLKFQHNPDAAQTTLQRLVHDFPQSVQAFAAQRHLKLMEVEAKLRKARSAAPDRIGA
jgi:hypothetical protein